VLSWPIDNPSVVYFLLVCVALGLLAGWWLRRKRSFLIGLGVVAAVAVVFFLLTLLIDTDRKRITRALGEMSQGVREKNLDKTFGRLSDDFTMEFSRGGVRTKMPKSELRQLADRAVRKGGVTDVVFGDIGFDKVAGDEATVTFRANPFGSWVLGGEHCYCEATFRRGPDGKWRMTNVTLFHPIQSKELLELPI
jgi:hypothetical protein